MKTDVAPTAKYLKDYRSPDFLIDKTDLLFELNDTATIVTSTLSIVRNGEHTASLNLDGDNLQLKSVEINGDIRTSDSYHVEDGQLQLTNVPDQFELKIVTEINPEGNKALEGLYKSGGAFCTQCEAEGFRRITYYLDRPDVLSIFTTTIIARESEYPDALSNGNLIEKVSLGNGLHKAVWHDPFKKPAYLFALVAGDFDCLQDVYQTQSGRNVALEFYVDKGNLHRAEFAMQSLKHAMKWDEDTFDLEYDLDIYMVVAVDFFNMGAMENKGLNVFNSRYVLADPLSATDTDYHNIEAVIGHEYFHNWTGNRVTCRDWFQLSLKEGLTVFRDQQFSADMGSPVVNRIDAVKVMRAHQFAEDAGPMAHPIRPEKVIEMNNFYTVTVYDKGAEVIRMMHTLLGQEGFKRGMDLYFERHDGQAVTCDDFVDAMADANKRDLSLFRRWYSQSGTPELKVSGEWNEATAELTVDIEQIHQATADQPEKLALHIPIAIEVIAENGVLNNITVDGDAFSGLIELTKSSDRFVFTDVIEQPCLSVCQNFSAPVRVTMDSRLDNPAWVIAHASDGFARWDAVQSVYQSCIESIYQDDLDEFIMPVSLVDALSLLMKNLPSDLSFAAELLTLPSISTLQEGIEKVDMLRLSRARDIATKSLALALERECQLVYAQFKDDNELLTGQAAGARSLKNKCLSLMAYVDPDVSSLLQSQYRLRSNMTDKLGVLNICAEHQLPVFDELMKDFFKQGEHDSLTADKYLALVSCWRGDDVFERVATAKAHPQYSDTNPNKVRALWGPLFNINHAQFYRADGQGMGAIKQLLIDVDSVNPQLASRLLTPLLNWKRLCEQQGSMMRDVLDELKGKPDLSKDVFEKVSKALEVE